jgi:hypothetical protein
MASSNLARIVKLYEQLTIELNRGNLKPDEYKRVLEWAGTYTLTKKQIRGLVERIKNGATQLPNGDGFVAYQQIERNISEELSKTGIPVSNYYNLLLEKSKDLPKNEPPFWEMFGRESVLNEEDCAAFFIETDVTQTVSGPNAPPSTRATELL